jgi:hypothetical protein
VAAAAAPQQSLELFSPSKVGRLVFAIVCFARSPRSTVIALTTTISGNNNTQINVFLRVIRRREDGYHDLASLFHVR